MHAAVVNERINKYVSALFFIPLAGKDEAIIRQFSKPNKIFLCWPVSHNRTEEIVSFLIGVQRYFSILMFRSTRFTLGKRCLHSFKFNTETPFYITCHISILFTCITQYIKSNL